MSSNDLDLSDSESLLLSRDDSHINPLNKESEKKIIEKIKAMSKLDNNMKIKESDKK